MGIREYIENLLKQREINIQNEDLQLIVDKITDYYSSGLVLTDNTKYEIIKVINAINDIYDLIEG